MIEKSMLIKVCITALFLSACSQNAPELNSSNAGSSNVSDATLIGENVSKVAGDTVAIDESTYGNENIDTNNAASSQNTGQYNSSGSGFQSIYFPFGGYGISAGMANTITSNISTAKQSSAHIKIAGNCDEFGTDEYNYALGLKRAKAVKDAIVVQGVSASKITIISYGESNPACTTTNDACYSQNRRVDLHLVK